MGEIFRVSGSRVLRFRAFWGSVFFPEKRFGVGWGGLFFCRARRSMK